jgi:flagellar basal-body rod modification protein FlgD
MSTAAVGRSAGAVIDTTPTAPPSVKSDPLANEETFLKLLVSQLKNQDPLNPPDTSQFVGQLTAYSQLEQLIGIRQNTNSATAGTDAATTAANISNTK